MRINLDENLPTGLVPLLTALEHKVDTVPAEGIGGEDDDVVWRTAQADGRHHASRQLTGDIRVVLIRRKHPSQPRKVATAVSSA